VIGSLPFKEGSLVNPNVEMPLTTVSDTKNVHAYFTMNEKNNCSLNQTFKE
jgi:membrane fusion protein (multidrug efflux system)